MAVGRFPLVRGFLEATICLSLACPCGSLRGADCNENCLDDAAEVALEDCNANGVPDDCDLKPAGADFDRGPPFSPGGVPGSLEAVDLDLDGFPDIVTGDASLFSSRGGGVAIRFNDGSGKLEDPWSLMVPDSVAGTLVHADFNRDGDVDIAIASRAREGCREFDRLSILENQGHREFAAAVAHEAGRDALDLEAADFDLDGDADIATASGGAVTLLRNRGDGGFDRPEPGSGTNAALSIAAADLDGDDDIDLAAVHEWSGHVSIFANSGNGTFEPSAGVQADDRMGFVLADDLDRDGDFDLFVASLTSTGTILENLGGGQTWRGSSLYGAGRTGCTADIDRDGLPDLVLSRGRDVQVLRNSSLLSFEAADSVYLQHGALLLVPADMDADGDEDVIAFSNLQRMQICVVHNRGGDLEGPVVIDAGLALAAADLDGDGDVDLATAHEVLRNSGTGRFPPEDRLFRGDLENHPTSVDAGDLDGDADLDLAETSFMDGRFPRLWVYPNDGAALFSTSVELFSDLNSPFDEPSVSIGDIDGDGDLDLVALATRFRIHPFINEGGGTFRAGERTTTGSEPVVLATGDLDGDGIDDLVTGNREVLGTANVSVFRSLGDGIFATGRNYNAGSRARWISLGDIDDDGDLDAASGGVHLLVNDGTGILESRRISDVEARSGLLADLDGDGDLDVAAGDRTLLINDGKGGFDSRGRPAQADGVHLLGADLDGDRDIDLIEGGVSVAWNLGGASFEAPWKAEVPRHPHLTGVVDRDADGDLDFTAASGPFAGFLDAAAGGRFESARWRLLAPEEFILPMMLVDLDRNAGLEMVFITGAFEKEGFWRFTLFKLPDGVDAALREEVLDLGLASDIVFDLDAGDLDGDADLDLVVTEFNCGAMGCTSTVFILLNDGRGNLSAVTLPGSARRMRLAPVDLDGDGDLDLATDNVSIYRNLDGAVFVGPVLIAPGCCGLATGDVDADGDNDLVTGEALFRNDGDGRAFDVIAHRSTLGSDVALGDLDDDGFPDLVGSTFDGHRMAILVNDGKGGLHASVWLPPAAFIEFLEDMDADGRPDIVARVYDASAIHWNRIDGPIARGEYTDLDSDGEIDGCQTIRFTRGDATSDRNVDIADAIGILRHLFQGAPEPGCLDAADVDDDSRINVTDPILILVFLFQGGAPPTHPGPGENCGRDSESDGIDCRAYPEC